MIFVSCQDLETRLYQRITEEKASEPNGDRNPQEKPEKYVNETL